MRNREQRRARHLRVRSVADNPPPHLESLLSSGRVTILGHHPTGMIKNPSSANNSEAVDCPGAPGRRRGFEDFLSEQRDALVKFLRRRTATPQDAEDGAQESLTRLLRYQAVEPAQWKRLLYRIATNVATDQARVARTHYQTAHHDIEAAAHDVPSAEPSADERLAYQQELAVIRELILSLPPRCREVFLLNRIEGMSFLKIARHLNISAGAVERHMAKALIALRQGVGERAAGPF